MKYRRKAVVLEAAKFNGSSSSKAQIENWMAGGECPKENGIHTRDICQLTIETLEGDHLASPGDYIIKGVRGEFYPCKPDIFEKIYELAE